MKDKVTLRLWDGVAWRLDRRTDRQFGVWEQIKKARQQLVDNAHNKHG